jgi:hypothetical protein
VKTAKKKKEDKKTSTDAAAIECKGEDIILGAIECGEIIFCRMKGLQLETGCVP